MNIFLTLFLVIIIYMTIWFGVAVVIKRNDIADIAWGAGFVILSWIAFLMGTGNQKSIVTNILVTMWGTRLASHIYRRNLNKEEDYRYMAWRKSWNNFYLRSYLQIFVLQGVLLYLISLPVIWINLNQNTWQISDICGVAIWIIGFWFESTGDKQLREFVVNPKNKGKIMDTGLWKYTRHPNYFGEVIMWWGIWLMTLSNNGGLTIVGPLLITFLIMFVSGVPLLEKKFAGRIDWEIYKSKTSVLIPWWPTK